MLSRSDKCSYLPVLLRQWCFCIQASSGNSSAIFFNLLHAVSHNRKGFKILFRNKRPDIFFFQCTTGLRIPLSCHQKTSAEKSRIAKHQLHQHHTSHRLSGSVNSLFIYRWLQAQHLFYQFYGSIRLPSHPKIIISSLSGITRSQYKTRLPILPVAGRPYCRAFSLGKGSGHIL